MIVVICVECSEPFEDDDEFPGNLCEACSPTPDPETEAWRKKMRAQDQAEERAFRAHQDELDRAARATFGREAKVVMSLLAVHGHEASFEDAKDWMRALGLEEEGASHTIALWLDEGWTDPDCVHDAHIVAGGDVGLATRALARMGLTPETASDGFDFSDFAEAVTAEIRAADPVAYDEAERARAAAEERFRRRDEGTTRQSRRSARQRVVQLVMQLLEKHQLPASPPDAKAWMSVVGSDEEAIQDIAVWLDAGWTDPDPVRDARTVAGDVALATRALARMGLTPELASDGFDFDEFAAAVDAEAG
jgi:hypothetical protein